MYFPPEWHEQEFVQLTWPHEQTDWAPILDEVYDCFIKMALEISKRENLLILAQKPDELWTLESPFFHVRTMTLGHATMPFFHASALNLVPPSDTCSIINLMDGE